MNKWILDEIDERQQDVDSCLPCHPYSGRDNDLYNRAFAGGRLEEVKLLSERLDGRQRYHYRRGYRKGYEKGYQRGVLHMMLIAMVLMALWFFFGGSYQTIGSHQTRYGETSIGLMNQLSDTVAEVYGLDNVSITGGCADYMSTLHRIQPGDVWIIAMKQSLFQRLTNQATIDIYYIGDDMPADEIVNQEL